MAEPDGPEHRIAEYFHGRLTGFTHMNSDAALPSVTSVDERKWITSPQTWRESKRWFAAHSIVRS